MYLYLKKKVLFNLLKLKLKIEKALAELVETERDYVRDLVRK